MFGIGGFELFLILLFGFLIFGPDKLPKIANTLGKAIAKFRGAQEDMTAQLKNHAFVDPESDQPFKNPLEVIENAADEAKANADAAKKKADEATVKIQERSESFAERKARYDRERAAKKAEAAPAEAAKESVPKKEKPDPVADVAPKKVVEEADQAAEAAVSKAVSEAGEGE